MVYLFRLLWGEREGYLGKTQVGPIFFSREEEGGMGVTRYGKNAPTADPKSK